MRIYHRKSSLTAEPRAAVLMPGLAGHHGWQPCGGELLCFGGLAHKHPARMWQEGPRWTELLARHSGGRQEDLVSGQWRVSKRSTTVSWRCCDPRQWLRPGVGNPGAVLSFTVDCVRSPPCAQVVGHFPGCDVLGGGAEEGRDEGVQLTVGEPVG
jgi:hypothetical protein